MVTLPPSHTPVSQVSGFFRGIPGPVPPSQITERVCVNLIWISHWDHSRRRAKMTPQPHAWQKLMPTWSQVSRWNRYFKGVGDSEGQSRSQTAWTEKILSRRCLGQPGEWPGIRGPLSSTWPVQGRRGVESSAPLAQDWGAVAVRRFIYHRGTSCPQIGLCPLGPGWGQARPREGQGGVVQSSSPAGQTKQAGARRVTVSTRGRRDARRACSARGTGLDPHTPSCPDPDTGVPPSSLSTLHGPS